MQDGLDEMLNWLGGVESSLKEQGQVPLNSAALQDLISKNIVSNIYKRKKLPLNSLFLKSFVSTKDRKIWDKYKDVTENFTKNQCEKCRLECVR